MVAKQEKGGTVPWLSGIQLQIYNLTFILLQPSAIEKGSKIVLSNQMVTYICNRMVT